MYGYGSDVRKRGGKSNWEPTLPVYTADILSGETTRTSWCLKLLMIVVSLLLLFMFVVVVFFAPKFEAQPNELSDLPKWRGMLTPSDELRDAERLLENEISGPEAIAEYKGSLYTGTADGKILRIEGKNVQVLATLGKPPCGGYDNEPTCGRPLGMRMANGGHLYVIDAYYGLYRVNIMTGQTELLLSSDTEVDGRPCAFLNDLDIASNGLIYLTDSSRWQHRDFPYAILEAGNDGRLLRFDPRLKKAYVIGTGLHFPNGIQLSRDENFLMVSETSKARIIKYYIAGHRRGEREVFVDNLPGTPGNIRRRKNGGFWVALSSARKRETFSMLDYLAARPMLRNLLSRLPAKWLANQAPPTAGLVVHINTNGEIVRILHDSSGDMKGITHVEEDQWGKLYIGSYSNSYIGRLRDFK